MSAPSHIYYQSNGTGSPRDIGVPNPANNPGPQIISFENETPTKNSTQGHIEPTKKVTHAKIEGHMKQINVNTYIGFRRLRNAFLPPIDDVPGLLDKLNEPPVVLYNTVGHCRHFPGERVRQAMVVCPLHNS